MTALAASPSPSPVPVTDGPSWLPWLALGVAALVFVLLFIGANRATGRGGPTSWD